jgi:hypothetical protein
MSEIALTQTSPHMSPLVTKFAYYRSLSATIDNSLSQENKKTSVERQEFESLSLRHKIILDPPAVYFSWTL